MDLKAEMTEACFSVTLSTDDFLAVLARDKREIVGGKTLSEMLDKISGVRNVEYNGHFGPAIYYSADIERMKDHQPVLTAISNYLKVER